jgi:hypothetical protein
LPQELLRGQIAEGLMRADGVVDFLPVTEFAVEFFHFQGAGGDLVELLGVGAVGAFDGAVEFGRTWRQDEQMEAALLAGLLELGGKLGSAIDLHRADGERHAVLQGVEELSGGESGGPGVGLEDVPAGNHIAGGELFEDPRREWDARPEYRLRPGRRAGKPRIPWVCARRRDGDAARGATPELRCGAVPPGGRAVSVAPECVPPWR